MKRDDTWVEMEGHYVVRIKGTDRYVDAGPSVGDSLYWRSDVERPFATEMSRAQAYELVGGSQKLTPVKVTVWKRFWRGTMVLAKKKVNA